MKESTFFQMIVERGHALGYAFGYALGIVEGERRIIRKQQKGAVPGTAPSNEAAKRAWIRPMNRACACTTTSRDQ